MLDEPKGRYQIDYANCDTTTQTSYCSLASFSVLPRGCSSIAGTNHAVPVLRASLPTQDRAESESKSACDKISALKLIHYKSI